MLDGRKLAELYQEEIHQSGKSVFTGGETTESTEHFSNLAHTPLIQAFLDDCDIQEITICSGNIGFVRTFTKRFKVRPGTAA